MPVRLEGETVHLEGSCTIEEAEGLHAALQGLERPVFEVGRATHIHTALVQLVMAAGGRVGTPPEDQVLRACLSACAGREP